MKTASIIAFATATLSLFSLTSAQADRALKGKGSKYRYYGPNVVIERTIIEPRAPLIQPIATTIDVGVPLVVDPFIVGGGISTAGIVGGGVLDTGIIGGSTVLTSDPIFLRRGLKGGGKAGKGGKHRRMKKGSSKTSSTDDDNDEILIETTTILPTAPIITTTPVFTSDPLVIARELKGGGGDGGGGGRGGGKSVKPRFVIFSAFCNLSQVH